MKIKREDWDQWIPMFLMVYRSLKQETIEVTPAELYLGQDLRLPLDLLRGCPPSSSQIEKENYSSKLKEILESIHQFDRERFLIRSKNVKSWYNQRARKEKFEPGQKV